MASGAESTADSGILAGAVGKGVCDSIYLGQIDLAVGGDLGRDLIARGGGAHAITAGSGDGFHAMVSRPEEFHLQPLAEPCVSLSPHTAPIRRTRRQYLSANARRDAGSLLR